MSGKLAAKIGAGAAALAIPLVMYFEGYIPSVYRDPIGRFAVCYGHDDQSLTLGEKYSKAECEELLADDLVKHSEALKCVPGDLKPHEKAAIVSFAFNVGTTAFCKSTMAHKFNEHNIPAACAELSRWTIAGGRELPGLVKRRAAERAVCEGKPWQPV